MAKDYKSSSKFNMVVSLMGILFLVAAVGVGVYSTSLKKNINEKAATIAGYRSELKCLTVDSNGDGKYDSSPKWCLDYYAGGADACPNDAGAPVKCSAVWWDNSNPTCTHVSEACTGSGGGGGEYCPTGQTIICNGGVSCKASCKFPNRWAPGVDVDDESMACGHTSAGVPQFECLICTCQVTPSPTSTPKPPVTPTPTPSPTPTPRAPTPTPTLPGGVSCSNWGSHETSILDTSDIVKVSGDLKAVTKVKTYSLLSGGIYNLEAMDSDPKTNILYVISSYKKSIYTMNTNPNDSIADGTLTLVAPLSSKIGFSGISFRLSDGSLWGWSKNNGLYTIDKSTGALTRILASTLSNVEGVAWDNQSKYLYLSRTPSAGIFELYRYNPLDNSLSKYANLPEDTDALDFAPSDYLGGYLVGLYKSYQGVTIYTYDVNTKTVIAKYPIKTAYGNIDAFAVCVK